MKPLGLNCKEKKVGPMTTEEKLFPKEEEKKKVTPEQKAVIDGMLSCGNATYSHETIDGRNYIVFRVRVY